MTNLHDFKHDEESGDFVCSKCGKVVPVQRVPGHGFERKTKRDTELADAACIPDVRISHQLKHVPIDASLKPPKDFKTEISEFIVGLILFAAFIVVPGILIVWSVHGLQDPSIAPWEMARDQGWLPWTVRVNTNIGTQWLPEEERICVSEEYVGAKLYGDDPIGLLNCSISGTTYHNIPVEFSGQRVTPALWLSDIDKAKNVIPRQWRCRRNSRFLNGDNFSCQVVTN